jgi:hypothetical protein
MSQGHVSHRQGIPTWDGAECTAHQQHPYNVINSRHYARSSSRASLKLSPLLLNSAKKADMKFPMRSGVPLALAALAAVSSAEEALYSKRMAKRGLDAQGNYNICMIKASSHFDNPLTSS